MGTLEGGRLLRRVVVATALSLIAAGGPGAAGAGPAAGDTILLGGDLTVQLEVQNVCAGSCLQDAPAQLSQLEWIGVTYLRKGKVRATVIDMAERGMDPVNPEPPKLSVSP